MTDFIIIIIKYRYKYSAFKYEYMYTYQCLKYKYKYLRTPLTPRHPWHFGVSGVYKDWTTLNVASFVMICMFGKKDSPVVLSSILCRWSTCICAMSVLLFSALTLFVGQQEGRVAC